ncbi:MAG: YwaF family protein [Clostridiales bacterium]|nr:YwaF family protein [Clostridiales bacterium]
MLGIYYLIGACAMIIVIAVGLLLHFKASSKLNILLKTVSLLIATALFFRYMLATDGDNIAKISHLKLGYGFESKALIVIALLQVWLAYAAEMFVSLASFFKVRTAPAIVRHFATTVFIVNFALMGTHIMAIVGPQGFEGFDVRATLIAVETGLGLGYAVVSTFAKSKETQLHNREWVWFTLAVVGIILAAIPSYAFNVVLDATQLTYNPKGINLPHRLMLYPMFIIPIVLYLLLKDKDLQTKRLALMYYAWIGLLNFSYFHRFSDFVGEGWVTALPLHLCNTAMYITPLCLTFKWKRFFYFTYFINVLGAFLALLMPNYSDSASIISNSVWLFYMNHYQAFFMPLLIVGLGIFRRPRWKEFGYSMIGFTVYFVLMLIINAWFTNYNGSVDYFFLNSDFIADKLGNWAENTRNITWVINVKGLTLTFYPLYQFLFFLVYFAFAFGVWFVYELGYNAITGWLDLAERNKKIKVDKLALEVKLAGRSIEEPMNMDNVNKLVLKNFTKRYGKSDVYAVKDACLEVCGGEIYGFLGPNGAGKSTIIKSIVGIQTITDGAIEVCGYDVATQSVQAKKQIGFVPDHYALYERLTAREYINYIADLYEVSKADRDERLDKMIKRFELEHAIDNPIRTYSHGMKQKVTIMAALIHNPKVWILDEPLTGLDPNSIFQVKECMREHAQAGNIVFFSSHIIDVVERICDKIAIIRKGQIQCVRDVHEMEKNGESLEKFYMSVINDTVVEPIAVGDKQEIQEKPKKARGKRA